VGSVSGLTGAIMAVLNVNQGLSVPVAIGGAGRGRVVGAIHGFFFARVGVPSFWSPCRASSAGRLAALRAGQRGHHQPALRGWHRALSAHLLPAPVGYAIGAAVVVLYLFLDIASTRRRVKSGLPSRPISESIVRAVLLAVALFVTIYVLNQAEGCAGAAHLRGFIAAFDWILRRTATAA